MDLKKQIESTPPAFLPGEDPEERAITRIAERDPIKEALRHGSPLLRDVDIPAAMLIWSRNPRTRQFALDLERLMRKLKRRERIKRFFIDWFWAGVAIGIVIAGAALYGGER